MRFTRIPINPVQMGGTPCIPRRIPTLRTIIVVFLMLICPSRGDAQSPPKDPIAEFKKFATLLASQPPFDCNADRLASPSVHSTEDLLFGSAAEAILQGLNRDGGNAAVTAENVLKNLVNVSDVANAGWPKDNRFKYRLLDLKPMVLVQFSIRSSDSFAAFGVPESIGRTKNTNWMRLSFDDLRSSPRPSASDKLQVYALHRGPSGRPRFLAKFDRVDCGSGWRIEYAAYEWNPSDAFTGSRLRSIIQRHGVEPGGEVTANQTLTMSYCWHSVVDTSARASLCSVDVYDVSGDEVRFVETRTNRPDLEAVARIIEHAQARDLRAVEAYSANRRIASAIVQQIPSSHLYFAGVSVKPIAPDREFVELEDGIRLRFELSRVDGLWKVTALTME